MSGDRPGGVAAELGTEGGAARVLSDIDMVPKMQTGIPGWTTRPSPARTSTREIESFRPARLADSLSALERSGSARGFREFLIVLTSYVKAEQLPTSSCRATWS